MYNFLHRKLGLFTCKFDSMSTDVTKGDNDVYTVTETCCICGRHFSMELPFHAFGLGKEIINKKELDKNG